MRDANEGLIRAINVVLAAVALVGLSSLIAVLALLVKLTSRGPVLYRQERVGRTPGELPTSPEEPTADVSTFVLYKFRTMRPEAEEGRGPTWSTPGDERVTPLGRWLRRLHLDEIPQFWNVLRGDMNIVGPRPERPDFVRRLVTSVPAYAHRLRVRPGITGLAQILRGPDASVEDVRCKLTYDLVYLRRRSLGLDFRIMARTPLEIFRGVAGKPPGVRPRDPGSVRPRRRRPSGVHGGRAAPLA